MTSWPMSGNSLAPETDHLLRDSASSQGQHAQLRTTGQPVVAASANIGSRMP